MEHLATLLMLILLQAVLGFDNLLYISLESKRAPKESQRKVRISGIGVAIVLRIVLLFVLTKMVAAFQTPWFGVDFDPWIHASVNGHSLIVLIGGIFILYTALKEIWHMIALDQMSEHEKEQATKTAFEVTTWIVLMNLVFSFDSILSAMALTEVFWIMAVAIVISGLLMIFLAESVAKFFRKKPHVRSVGFVCIVCGGHHADHRRRAFGTFGFYEQTHRAHEQNHFLFCHWYFGGH
jgi:predicted tellurium resistance membrane protein TerC